MKVRYGPCTEAIYKPGYGQVKSCGFCLEGTCKNTLKIKLAVIMKGDSLVLVAR
jgi:hypothetical protein